MNYYKGIAAALCMLAFAGCTTSLETHQGGEGRYVARGKREDVSVGPDYWIPMLQFNIKIQRTLVQCTEDALDATTRARGSRPNPSGAAKNADERKGGPKVSIRFLSKLDLEPTYVSGERIKLDYEELSSWSKTSSLRYETYDGERLKSINAEAADQTKAIVGNVVKSAVSIASLATGVPLPAIANAAQAPGEQPRFACSPETVGLLADIKSQTKALASKTDSLVSTTDKIARLERLAGMGALTSAQKLDLDKTQQQAKSQAKDVELAQKELTALVDRVSATETIVWPRDPKNDELNAGPNILSKKKIGALLAETTSGDGYTTDQWVAAMMLWGRLKPLAVRPDRESCNDKDQNCSSKQVKAKDAQGILYRSPVPARLIVCSTFDSKACDLDWTTASTSGASGIVASTTVMAPQFGRLSVLPYRNGAFQNNVLKVTFREDGSVATLGYDEKAARGVELSGAVSDSLGQALGFRDAYQVDKEKKAAAAVASDEAKKKAALDDLDNEIARLQKVKQINELTAETAQASDSSDMEAETARLNAKIALLEARRKLRDAEAQMNAVGTP